MPKLTSHPGVTVVQASNGAWRARWKDPRTSKYVWLTLQLRTEPERLRWAKDKSRSLARDRMAIASGAAPRGEWLPIPDAIGAYFNANEKRLRSGTLRAYGDACELFKDWARSTGVTNTGQLTRERLAAFRAWLAAQPKHVQIAGAGRNEFKATTERRSAASINRELRALHTVLSWLREHDHVPLTQDEIRDGTKREAAGETELPQPIARERIRELVKACQEHEPRVAPLLIALLLTGMRFSEGQGLKWASVDIANGYVALTPTETKTKRGRRVDLGCSPALKALLESLPTKPKAGGDLFCAVFTISRPAAESARKRLRKRLGWSWTWQELRQTCASYLCSAPWYGPFRSAKRLGHSTQISDRLYADSIAIDPEARDLETAMGIQDLLAGARG